MPRLLIYPGELTDLVDVDDVLRAQHEEVRARREADIARYQEAGAPLDDGEGNTLETIAPYVPNRYLDEVKAVFRVLAAREWRVMNRDSLRALEGLRNAKGQDEVDAAGEAYFTERCAFITACVQRLEVGGVAVDLKDPDLVAVLDRNNLVLPLAQACTVVNELGPKKASRSGASPASTSRGTNAARAQSTTGAPSAATAAPRSTAAASGTPAPDGNPTSAPADISSGTLT